MQNKGKLTIMKYFRACVGSFLVFVEIKDNRNLVSKELEDIKNIRDTVSKDLNELKV